MRPQRTTLLTLVFAIASLFGASVASAQMSSGEFTYAVEINGVVCGYADVDVSTVKGKHGDYTLFEQQTFMMMSALGSEFNTSVDLTFHIDPASGDFSFMQSHIQQADFTIDATIRIEEGVARCTSTLLTEEEKLVALSDDVLIGNPLYDVHLLGVFADGTAKQVTRPVFDAMEFEVQPTTFTWSGRETLELAGTTFETIIVDTLAQGTGVRSRLWIDVTNGMTVQVEGQLGQRVYLADPSVRKRIELVNRDENILIRTNVTIPNIQRISFMKVEAVLEPTGQWITVEDLNVPGQRFTGTVIENRIEGVFEVEHVHFDGAGAMPYPLPAIDDASLRPYLQPSPFVESGDPVLIRKAEELAAGSADAWDAAVRLSRWVADNITYEIPGGGTARRTYDMRAGECGSHSILLATFCRALGIPSRVVWGCMYTPNLGGAFGQHAWTEVFMGDAGWIPVDSTAHEADFVDSGHIRLGEHQSLSIALNAKSMQVLDYQVALPSVSTGDGETDTDEAYEAFLGMYDPPRGGEPFEVLVADGGLAIDIPGQMVLSFNDPDDAGRWYCTLTNNLYCTFERNEAGDVIAMHLLELARMRRIGPPALIGDEVPVGLREFLGEYRFPGRPSPFVISFDDGRLATTYETGQEVVHMEPTDVEGRWIDEYGGNGLTFDRDDEGMVSALILEVDNRFERRFGDRSVGAADVERDLATDSTQPSVTESSGTPPEMLPENQIAIVLDAFNQAATNADLDAYFACLAPGAVFIGTDATERWTLEALRALLEPHFDQGRGRRHTPRGRHVTLYPGGRTASFDELVEIETLGTCRGTGVMVRLDGEWLIGQYALSFAVPNAIALDVVDLIERTSDTGGASTDDTGIREAVESYMATVAWPDPAPIDPELFARDVEAIWSDGSVHLGRDAIVRALQKLRREQVGAFDSFRASAEHVRVRRAGTLASLRSRIDMSGVRSANGRAFARTVRSTLVLERREDGRWQIVHEHSSPVEPGRPAFGEGAHAEE